MSYRELPAPARSPGWCGASRLRVPAARGSHRVLPDGCADIVWTGDRLVVAGLDTGPVLVADSGGEAAVGVRFRPGAAAAALGLPAAELLDERVALDALWGAEGRRLEAAVAAATARRRGWRCCARRWRGGRRARRRRTARGRGGGARRARSGPPGAGARGRAGAERAPVHRRFSAAVGYGPKTFARVARFRRALRLLGDPAAGGGLARVALEAGYADQQHLARECGALAGCRRACCASA